MSALDLEPGVRRVLQLIEDEAVEDGAPHPAEAILRALAEADPEAFAERVVRAIGEEAAGTAAELVLCAARIPEAALRGAVRPILEAALAHPSVLVRAAAVKAAEAWGSEPALAVLRQHDEPAIALASEIRRIAFRGVVGLAQLTRSRRRDE